MPWLIGVDEAGYGPNLGPLVVAATLWHLTPSETLPHPEKAKQSKTQGSAKTRTAKTRAAKTAPASSVSTPDEWDLYARLNPVIAPPPKPASLHVADSKKLYSPQRGLQPLQQIALVTAELLGLPQPYDHWLSLAHALSASQPHPILNAWPWYDSTGPSTQHSPATDSATNIEALCSEIRAQASLGQVRLAAAAVNLVEPQTFNDACDACDNKSTVLSNVTLELVRTLIQQTQTTVPDEPILCRCDRHGGRARYRGLLEAAFPETWFEPLQEDGRMSRYRGTSEPPSDSLLAPLSPPSKPQSYTGALEVRFEVGSEQFLETAWASCLAKYFREQAMDAFNEFWAQRIPGLVPTRGYPVDAARFLAAIEPAARKLGIPHRTFWRYR